MRTSITLLMVSTILLLACSASAQVASALIEQGQPLPGSVNDLIGTISGPAVNHGAGGYAFNLNTVVSPVTTSRAWGTITGGLGDNIRAEGIFGIYEQNSWESFFGFGGDGQVSYSPSCTNLDTGTSGLDGVWLDDLPIAVEEEVYPHLDGWFWSFGSRPGVTQDGIPYFVGGITDVQGGSTQNRGLFYGLDAAPLLLGGDFIGGVADPVTSGSGGISFDYRVSGYGTHWIGEVGTDSPSAMNRHVVIDGTVLQIDGSNVTEGTPVPAAAGGLPGENWKNFDYMGISEDGQYLFTGDTDGDTATDEFVVLNGMIVLREGDVIDGWTLTGAAENAYMNADGDYVVVWDVETLEGDIEALIFNGMVLLVEGDQVDTDMDGILDDAFLTSFTGLASLVLSNRDGGVANVYFTADVETGAPGPASMEPDEIELSLTAEELEALGYDEPVTISNPNRAEVEMGFWMATDVVVPTYLALFDVTSGSGSVTLNWQTAHADDASFEVIARAGSQQWTVEVIDAGNGVFSALDHPAGISGEVTYELYYRPVDYPQGVLLGSKTVTLETPTAGVRLTGAHPNPFNPQTQVTFAVDRGQSVRLSIYDMNGHLVQVLTDTHYDAGTHQVAWTGINAQGQRVPSGNYFARLVAEDGTQTSKLMLVK